MLGDDYLRKESVCLVDERKLPVCKNEERLSWLPQLSCTPPVLHSIRL